MNNTLLTSICSLTLSVPSGFLIYYLSGPSSAEQYSLSELSISENNNQYLIGKITSEISKNDSISTGPLKFTCAISGGQACDVKVLNQKELIKKNDSDLTGIQDLFVDAKQEQLTKGTYVQVNFNNEHGVQKTTKTETITIVGENTTSFTVEWENKKHDSFRANQEELIKQTITQTQEVYDVDNSRYCLIKFTNDVQMNKGHSWLFPRNTENTSGFLWRIGDHNLKIKDKQKVELYEIADQNKVAKKGTVQQDKAYFDTQNKFIQTYDSLTKQQNKWVKMVTADTSVSCKISFLDVRNKNNTVIKYFDTTLENYELKEKTSKQ